jgi:SH3-like domain-containing protein
MNSPRIRRLAAALIALAVPPIIASAAQADPVVVGEEHCVVNVQSDDVLNMREAPNASAPVVARKPYGECGIRVIAECEGNWCPVEDGHVVGWVHSHYIAMVSPSLYCVSGVAADDTLNLRAFPSAGSRIVAELEPDQCDIAFLPYAVGDWQKIRVEGWEGWVARRYLSGE